MTLTSDLLTISELSCGTARTAVLAPGQGAQKPGMLLPWLSPDVERRLDRWSRICGIDLIRLGTTAEAGELVDTAITQPLVVATALVVSESLEATGMLSADTLVAGHSVGELAAAAVAGVLSAEDAIAVAAVRGKAMAAACELESTGMSAIVGGDPVEVCDRIARLGLVPANRNGAGQIVAAGRSAALQELSAAPPAGAKVVKLPVAGAFHTHFMEPAREALAAAAATVAVADPIRPLLSNSDGRQVRSGSEALAKIVAQLTAPVRWDLCMAAIAAAEASVVIELAPAGTLTGMVRRELPDVARHALKTPENLAAMAEAYGGTGR
ncbi:ACP S-malonyltransferase [Nocardia sp. NPDC088792]|uniref:ACP S-malonyltransferase n=1 Tax=Nocardia sp. NPDC088792 TaxID=3364332 RepID=UPI003804FDE8